MPIYCLLFKKVLCVVVEKIYSLTESKHPAVGPGFVF